MAFETEGTVQEARGLASSKKTSLDDVIAYSHFQNLGGGGGGKENNFVKKYLG